MRSRACASHLSSDFNETSSEVNAALGAWSITVTIPLETGEMVKTAGIYEHGASVLRAPASGCRLTWINVATSGRA